MNEKLHTDEDKDGGQKPSNKAPKPRRKRWRRLVRRVIARSSERRAERQAKKAHESKEERSAKSMTRATWWIAAFTVVLAIVAVLTLVELIIGGADTKALVDASKKQAWAAQRYADAAQRFADTAFLINGNINDAVGKLDRQAGATEKAASAATIAANTAKDALHVSERAYVVIEEPTLGDKSFSLPLVNTGRKPSGEATTITHMAFYSASAAGQIMDVKKPTDKAWATEKWDSILPGNHNGIAVPIPLMEQDKISIGLQWVIIAGSISYNDGFEGTPQQVWKYCYRTIYQSVMKKNAVIVCDPKVYLPILEKLDGYPLNPSPMGAPLR